MSEFVVNGQILGNTDYALAGLPKTDEQVAEEARAWEEQKAKEHAEWIERTSKQGTLTLFCPICEEWAGETSLRDWQDEEEKKRLRAELISLCRHHTEKWKRKPENKHLNLEEFIAMENRK